MNTMLYEQIKNMITESMNLQLVQITKKYSNEAICDIQTDNGVLHRVKCSVPVVNAESGLLCRLNDNTDFIIVFNKMEE